jgi:hypothetical protein
MMYTLQSRLEYTIDSESNARADHSYVVPGLRGKIKSDFKNKSYGALNCNARLAHAVFDCLFK